MSQVMFSQSPLASGTTSRSFKLHSFGSEQGHQATFVVCWTRDVGTIIADTGYDVNTNAQIVVQQLLADGTTQNTLFTGDNSDLVAGAGYGTFQADPLGGTLSIVNNGPGNIQTVQVLDEMPR